MQIYSKIRIESLTHSQGLCWIDLILVTTELGICLPKSLIEYSFDNITQSQMVSKGRRACTSNT